MLCGGRAGFTGFKGWYKLFAAGLGESFLVDVAADWVPELECLCGLPQVTGGSAAGRGGASWQDY